MGHYTYKDTVYSLPCYYEESFEERHGREHDQDSGYNGDYWISTGEYITDLENRLEQFKELLSLENGEAITKLKELSNKEVWEQ